MKKLDHKELLVLETLKEAEQALGSWNLSERLEQKGVQVSSATIGRILSTLESAGYVKKDGVNGRLITTSGKRAILLEETSQYMSKHQATIENTVLASTLDEYMQILQARRAIERETARLAAMRISAKELKKLQSLLSRQDKLFAEGKSVATTDVDFHKVIAHASGNKILESLYYMLFPYGQQTVIFEQIRKQAGQTYTSGHHDILRALEQKSPELAEQAMLRHINQLIDDVERYWSAHIDALSR